MHDNVNFEELPVSHGIPKGVYVAMSIGLAMIFVMGIWTVHDSGFGHQWPAATSLRIDLGSMPTM